MSRNQEAIDHATAVKFTARVNTAERIIAFKSRVEEEMTLIQGISELEVVVRNLVDGMTRHALRLMHDAFAEAESEDEGNDLSQDRTLN